MKLKIPISQIQKLSSERVPKFNSETMEAGQLMGTFLLIDSDVHFEILNKFPAKPNVKIPPIITQAQNIATAVVQGIIHPTPVSREERERRLEICNQCEFLIDGKRCAKCGCTVKWKALLEAWHCPISKW